MIFLYCYKFMQLVHTWTPHRWTPLIFTFRVNYNWHKLLAVFLKYFTWMQETNAMKLESLHVAIIHEAIPCLTWRLLRKHSEGVRTANTSLKARFMGPTWGPPGPTGPRWATWNLFSGILTSIWIMSTSNKRSNKNDHTFCWKHHDIMLRRSRIWHQSIWTNEI